MKKVLLSFALVLSSLNIFAQGKFTFTADGDSYDDATKSFSYSLRVKVGYAYDPTLITINNQGAVVPAAIMPSVEVLSDLTFNMSDIRSGKDNNLPTDQNNPKNAIVGYKIYVTTDASDPATSTSATCVWDYTGNRLDIKPVTITSTGVVRACLKAVIWSYWYSLDDEQKTLGLVTSRTYGLHKNSTESATETAFQSYINVKEITKPTIDVVKTSGDVFNEKLDMFVNSVHVQASKVYNLNNNLVNFFGDYDVCTTIDGSTPSLWENVGKAGNTFELSSTATVRSVVGLSTKGSSNLYPSGDAFGKTVYSNETARTFTKAPLVDPENLVLNTPTHITDNSFVFTYGLNVKNIEYNGVTYSVLTNGKSSFTVKNGKNVQLKEEQVYYVGGEYSYDGNYDMVGFNRDDIYVAFGDKNTPITLQPTFLTDDNMIQYGQSETKEPLVNVAIEATGFKADGSANNFKIVNADKFKDLYDGDAIVEGILFGLETGRPSSKWLFYANNIIQKPEVIINENPVITLKKEKNVDSTKDLAVSVDFSNSYEIINKAISSSDLTVNFTASLRDLDGKQIEIYEGNTSKIDDVCKLTIPAKDITPDLEYVITVDNVAVESTTDFLFGREFDTAQKTFGTIAPKLLDQAISVFDADFTIPVLNVENIGIKDKDAIKVYNNVTGEEVDFTSVSASGNKVTFVVGNGGVLNSAPYVSGLNFGQYTVVFEAEALTLDEFINPKELSMNLLSGNDADKARIKLLSDIDRCFFVMSNAPRGVNVFQYTPVTCDKFGKEISTIYSEALYNLKNSLQTADELNAYNEKLREALHAFKPTLPAVNETYTFRAKGHKADNNGNLVEVLGKYLNIDGDTPVMSETPSYIQFHMIENDYEDYYDAFLLADVNTLKAQQQQNPMWIQPYTYYLYNTPNRKYLGAEYELDGKAVSGVKFTLSNDHNTPFGFYTRNHNEWVMNAICTNDYVSVSDYRVIRYEDTLTNDVNLTAAMVNKLNTLDFDAWYIEKVDAPEVEEVTPSEDESQAEATAINSVNSASDATYYSVSGSKLSAAQKGINIVKVNGKTMKVNVK